MDARTIAGIKAAIAQKPFLEVRLEKLAASENLTVDEAIVRHAEKVYIPRMRKHFRQMASKAWKMSALRFGC